MTCLSATSEHQRRFKKRVIGISPEKRLQVLEWSRSGFDQAIALQLLSAGIFSLSSYSLPQSAGFGSHWSRSFPSHKQEHYSHILLIPCLSLYVLYLNRKAILASREWSPWLGSLVIGIGGLGLLAGRSSDLRCRSDVDDDIGVGGDVVGDLCVRLRDHALPQGFIRATLSPLYGAASLFSVGCHHWVPATQFSRSD